MPESVYERAFQLIKQESDASSVEKGLSLLRAEAESRPNDAKAWFELAGAFDFLGREAEALPHYEKAMALGIDLLPVEDRPRLFVQLGSTLRNLKKYDQSKKVLQEGIDKFPGIAVLKTFLGLTEYSDGNYRKAAKLFLQGSLHGAEDRSLQDYGRALKNYSDQIDIFPARQRHWMRIYLADCVDPGTSFPSVSVKAEHASALAHLMDVSYRGTIDHEGETPEQCLAEMKGAIEGKYGPFLADASFVSLEESNAVSASLITLWKELPLLAYSMTAPTHQGRGIAGFLIRKSLVALKAAGYKELYLVVTEGNTPAENLYRKLGFEFLGPAIPGRGAKER